MCKPDAGDNLSASKRKIGLYSLEFVNKDNSKLEEINLINYFTSLIQTINNKSFEAKKEKIESSNKFYFISYHNVKDGTADIYQKGETIDITFESAKVGHRPDLIDETTGSKRKSPKKLHEGEDERTHFVAKFKKDEIIVALEERKVGVTISQIVSYFNKYISKLPEKEQYRIGYNIIPYNGFLENLDKFERISIGTIFINQQDIGSEFLDAAQFGKSVRDNIEVTFKAPSRKSIKRGLVKKWYSLTGRKSKINRIRLEGKSVDGARIRLDTESLKLIKHVDAKILEDTGLVDSEDLFTHLNALVKEL